MASCAGDSLDDRVGCALMIALIRSELEYIHFAFTVQEGTARRCENAALQNRRRNRHCC
jgi:putative aminopeptidase FrvX